MATGFTLFSRGAFFRSAAGQIVNGILSTTALGLIGWAFWHYGRLVGALESLVIFGGASIGNEIYSPVATVESR